MGKKKYLFLIAAIVLIVAISGCTSSNTTTSSNDTSTSEASNNTETSTASSQNVILKVTSDGSWSGSIQDDTGQRSVDGSGNQEFDLGPNPGIVAATMQKQGASGSLTVELVKGGKTVKTQTTTADYGVVTVSENF